MTSPEVIFTPNSGHNCLGAIDVAVLAGGKGTRLKDVLGDTPKILAPVGGRPFLDHLLQWLAGFGAAHVTLCLGFLAGQVIEARRGKSDGPLSVDYVVEPEPLGTGGALRLARPKLKSEPVVVMNGDSWTDANLCDLVESHVHAASEATILCLRVDDVSRYGTVDVDENLRMRQFVEKGPAAGGPGLVNAGVYVFSQAALSRLEDDPGPSLERDFLQNLPPGSVHCRIVEEAKFIDIGTPDSLRQAEHVLGTESQGRA